ncbi:MAG TPA: hypothetical protein VFJ57_00190 [Solirubrobacterales bacterium]|nr:hypothetical protein [Solirubrobacterales bacterium]
MESSRGADFDWSGYDAQIGVAAKAGLEVLPFLAGAPRWLVPEAVVPGTHGEARARFAGAAVRRYGPRGAFWAENPQLPQRPVRAWQIWNEPNFKYFVTKPNPAEYGKLVASSYAAIKAVDPGAKVILAGLLARPRGSRTASGKHKSPNWYASCRGSSKKRGKS